MRILVLSPEIPFPPICGGPIRTSYLIRALAKRHSVILVGFDWNWFEQFASIARNDASIALPINIIRVPLDLPYPWDDMPRAQRAYKSSADDDDEPWQVHCTKSRLMEATLREVSEAKVDAILIEHSPMGQYLDILPRDIPKILDFHNLLSLHWLRRAERLSEGAKEREQREARRMLRFEQAIASACALCLTVSEKEADAAKSLLGIRHLEVVPNGVDLDHFTPSDDASTNNSLLFTGLMDYQPNIDAVQFFAKDILPLVLREVPDATFHIVGIGQAREVRRLTSEHVVFHGFVPDVVPYYHQAKVIVVPLLEGGGTRLKILEAAACSKPIISTFIGAEGLRLQPGQDLLIADQAEAFARAVIELLRSDSRRHDLGQSARRAVLQYSWEKVGSRFCRIIERLSSPAPLAHGNVGVG